MRSMVGALVLVGLVGAMSAEVAAQENTVVFLRICEILPGQNAAAASLARQLADYYQNKFPGAQVNVFTHVLAPFDHIHWMSAHPDLASWESRNTALFADEGWLALMRRTPEVTDMRSCTDEIMRAVP